MRIIKDWRKAVRSYSAMALAFIAFIPMIWAELPPELVALIPAEWQKWIVVGVATAGLIGRFIKQGKEDGNT